MLRIAIVGCGKIADQHVEAGRRVGHCSVVSLCDRELLMARQLGERYGIPDCFSDLDELLRKTSPDVVHITTPPQSHFSLGMQCLKAGKHVYLEKPFTVTAEEAETLIRYAEGRNLKITAGHNYQFATDMLETRRLIDEGFLGGKPVHLESYWGYSLADPSYVAPVLGSKNHWVRQLPGQLMHNIISHGFAKLAEHLDDEIPEIHAIAHQSSELRALGGQEVLDELRVLMRDKSGTTALFSFSTQMKPRMTEVRIYGPTNSLVSDYISGTVVRHWGRSYKSYLTFFVPPFKNGLEYMRNAKRNISNFLGRRLHHDAGVKELVARFYKSIETNGPPPIPYREILLIARIMDEVFSQINEARDNEAKAESKEAVTA